MPENLRMPDPPGKGRDAGGESTARTCPACGAPYSGPFHKDCPSTGPTVKRAPGSESALDEIPNEAKPYADDPSRRLGQYVLVKQIGRGGMGTVWKAWDRSLTRWTAIKFLIAHEEQDVLRFQREAKLAARLRHPNVAAVYEVGRAGSPQPGAPEMPYLAMEYIEGKTLQEARLGVSEAVDVFLKVAQGIEAAHRAGVIHRDLKPHNIMVTSDLWPYVMDFGLAKAIAGDSSLSVSGSVIGTPAYMPPEQAEGKLDRIDARSDVYSLGATLYAVACGAAPFTGQTTLEILAKVCREEPPAPRAVRPEIPASLEAVIRKAMAKKSEDRYPSVAEMAKDLKKVQTGEAVAPPAAADRAPARPKSKGALVVAGLAAALAVLAAAGAGFFMRRPGPTSEKATPPAAEKPPEKPPPTFAPLVPPTPPEKAGVVDQKPPPPEKPPEISPELKLPPSPEKKPIPPPPTQAELDEVDWKQLRAVLAFDAWAAGDDKLGEKVNEHLARVLPRSTPAHEALVARWFTTEIDKARSLVKEGKKTPEERQALTRRVAGWSDAVDRSVRGIRPLRDVQNAVSMLKIELEEQPRGRFTLRIVVSPFGRIGRMTKDGKPVTLQKRDLPLVLSNLEIGDYEIDIVHPDFATRTVKVAGAGLTSGRTYVLGGTLSDATLPVKESP